jgi:predicted Zn-dependent protease
MTETRRRSRLAARIGALVGALALGLASAPGVLAQSDRVQLPDMGSGIRSSPSSDRIELPDMGPPPRSPLATDRIELPDIGSSSRSVLSSDRERALGEAFLRALRKGVPVVEDPEVETYIDALGQRLVAHSDASGARFSFFVVQDPRINAFAAPGGYIGVHTGLIAATESESELASVIAHEIGHVTQGHIARRFEMADRMTIPTLAALAASILLATQSGPAGAAAIAATQAGAIQMQIDFTRANELEADRVGVQTLAGAGFDPRSMPVFFERLQKSLQYSRRPPEYLSTHPVTESRIADTRGRAEQYPYRQQPDSLAFQMTRAKLRVLTAEDPVQVQRDFERLIASGQAAHEKAARYGHALALARAGKLQAAAAEMRALAAADPDNPVLVAERAKLEHATGNHARAVEVFEGGLALYPTDRILTLGYAEVLLQAGKPRKARDMLLAYGRGWQPSPRYYRLLARAEELSGNLLEAHLAMAEYQYQMGQTAQAVEQLERARKRAGDDFYAASRIDAKLVQLKEELEASKKRRP